MVEYHNFLNNLENENQYPIVFIGSGLTLRYFNEAPTWDGLLERLWDKVHPDSSFYGQLGLLKSELKESNYDAYLKIAEQLEIDFQKAFFSGKIQVDNLTQKDATMNNISPMKQEIANIFSTLSLRDNVEPELKSLTQLLKKSRLIITTNYDTMIENLLNNNIKVNIGGKSLFSKTDDFNELFKIHGSISDPNSIVLTKKDYQSSEQTSTLVNAKILSNLIDSPILFLGYSLTDKNVRSLLTDLSQNMPDELRQAANRIGVVEFTEGESNILETKSEFSDLNVHYTKIETDNYTEIYNKISKIDQGLSPNEISKYSSAFKQIIQKTGEAAQLDTVLASFIDLDKLPENLLSKNIVVAFGDARYIYKTPSYADYIEAYFCGGDDFPLEIALSYIEKYPPQSTLPIVSCIKQANQAGFDHSQFKDLNKLKEKINKRVHKEKFEFKRLLSDINVPATHRQALVANKQLTPKELFTAAIEVPVSAKIRYITKNITTYTPEQLQELTTFLLQDATHRKTLDKKTEYRKFFYAYSLLQDNNAIELQ